MSKDTDSNKNKENTTNFKEINNTSAIIEYLNDSRSRLRSGSYVCHYTTVDNLVKMMKTASLHLANPKNMNDQHEYSKGDASKWKNIFFSSFMIEDKESIGMWSMYAQPWERGVKIAIPKKIVRRWIKGIDGVSVVKDYRATNEFIKTDSKSLMLSCVAYSNMDSTYSEADKKLQWSTAVNKEFNVENHYSELTGYIKDMAWSYEKEIRIKAVIENNSNIERVSIPLTDEVIKEMVITASPLFKGNLMEEIEKVIKRSLTTQESLFRNKLNMKTICQNCIYR